MHDIYYFMKIAEIIFYKHLRTSAFNFTVDVNIKHILTFSLPCGHFTINFEV